MKQDAAAPTEARFAGKLGWVMFDWANQPFFTVITTFIFAPYFAAVVVGDAVRGQELWGYTQSLSGLCLALLSPVLGAAADATGPRKRFILFFQAMTCVGCVALWWVTPGASDALLVFAMAAVIVATVGAEFSIVFNNALLPTLAPARKLGFLSGLGWGMGYAGGLVALIAILIVTRPSLVGIETPPGEVLFGLDAASHEAERLTGPASALWLILFIIPMFLFTPDLPRTALGYRAAVVASVRQLANTIRRVRAYRNPFAFLIAFMIYNDGLAAVIAFGGIYAAGVLGWGSVELGMFGIILTTVALVCALVGGALDDRFGSRPTIAVAIVSTIIATIGIASVSSDSVLFFVEVEPRPAGAAPFSTIQEQVFLAFALLIGIGMGPMQAASRTMMGRLAPAHMRGEFYGLYALSGRATAFLAPLLIALATAATGTQQAAAGVVLVFLVLGLGLLLFTVREAPADG